LSRKNKKTIIESITLGKYAAEGKSIATMEDGKALFVEGGVPGDTVKVMVKKSKKNYAEGRMLALVSPSPDRISPFCMHFGVCGGCKWQMLPYEKQLEYKHQQVVDQLSRIGNLSLPEVMPIIGSASTRYYRNKLEFTFSKSAYLTSEQIAAANGGVIERKPALGFHAPGMFDKVVDITTCHLQDEPTNIIKNYFRTEAERLDLPYYDYIAHEGWLRNLIIRVATTGQIMVNLVVQHFRPELHNLLDGLLALVPNITSLNYTINDKLNDSIYDRDVVCYYGTPYIEEHLEQYRFKISPKSFFQTNTKQAEVLYSVTRDFAGLTGEEVLYDLYCGTGSIGIFCSDKAKSIIGIEVVDDAIKDAKINAEWNNLDKCKYFVGDVGNIATDDFFAKYGKPDVIITDPPRAGMSEKLIQQLLKMKAPRIVYVSCNPATQARDLALLTSLYDIKKVQPVDMFPHTHHIENVVLLELK
jgi:23S rRNA (uracil1939-C5)-methyltransferase